MKRAVQSDVPHITDFLRQNITTSMFPLMNLTEHGLDAAHPRSPRIWLRRADGRVTDVLSVTQQGMVMPQCPNGGWNEVARMLCARDLSGVIGPADQARSFIAAAGLGDVRTTLDEDEPLLELQLSTLNLPDGPGHIVPLSQVDKELILGWMETYQREALKTNAPDVARFAAEGYASNIERDSHVALIVEGRPVAMTGFNAAVRDTVQIGGVFTPEGLRGRGYARRAVALHLDQARRAGVAQAVLFSANASARRAYEAIGFAQTGDRTLCLFNGPAQVRQ